MTDWQNRVIAERDELRDKTLKLASFIAPPDGGVYDGLPKQERLLLARQFAAMVNYFNVLEERVQGFVRDDKA